MDSRLLPLGEHKAYEIIYLTSLTGNINFSQPLHKGDVNWTQHLLAGESCYDLRLCSFHHYNTVAVHSADVQVVVPRTESDPARTGCLTPNVVRNKVARSENDDKRSTLRRMGHVKFSQRCMITQQFICCILVVISPYIYMYIYILILYIIYI